MDSIKGDVEPGQRTIQDGNMVLVYDGVPDWVTMPPELGGGRVNVKHGRKGPCPCGRGHEVLILVLDEPTGIQVAECSVKGFMWFRPKN